jgi:hypothetical protein
VIETVDRGHQDHVSPRPALAPLLLVVTFTTVTFAVACTPLDPLDPAPASCEALDDEPEADAIPTTIELRNVGPVPLFLPEGGGDRHDLVYFIIDGVPRIDETGYPTLRCSTIEDNLGDLCSEEGLLKDSDRLVRLDPGASFEIPWDGYIWELISIDDACFDGPLCGEGFAVSCEAGRVVAPGSHLLLNVTAYAGCSMAEADCACPQGEASCEIPLEVGTTPPDLTNPRPPVTVEAEFTGASIVIELPG